jgi:hypothetical protein
VVVMIVYAVMALPFTVHRELAPIDGVPGSAR